MVGTSTLSHSLLLLATLLQVSSVTAFAPGALARLPIGVTGLRAKSTSTLRMQEEGEPDVPAVRRSFWSRNLSEEQLNAPRYYELENKGEFLAGPDRADMWGDEMTPIAKWQRTMGPIYIQGAGGALLVLGFLNYFGLGNANGLSQAMWTSSIFVALLGFALQRKTE